MPILVVCIIVSFMFYFFYKTKYFRTRRPMEKQWLSAKSGIALGLFMALFGVNQFFVHNSTVSTIIGVVFLLYGVLIVWNGIRRYKHLLPLARKEADEAN